MKPLPKKSARVILLSSLALAAAFSAQAKGPANKPAKGSDAASEQAAGDSAAETRELRDSNVQGSAPADLRKGVAPADLRKAAPATEVRDSRNP